MDVQLRMEELGIDKGGRWRAHKPAYYDCTSLALALA